MAPTPGRTTRSLDLERGSRTFGGDYDATWTIDAGSAQGLSPGMRLYLGGANELAGRPVSVESVEPHVARVTRVVSVTRDLAAELEGTFATSLHPEAPPLRR